MGYPGDQSQSGGWPPEQPRQSPSQSAPQPPSPYAPSSSGGGEGNPYAFGTNPYQPTGSGGPSDPQGGPGPYGEPPAGPYGQDSGRHSTYDTSHGTSTYDTNYGTSYDTNYGNNYADGNDTGYDTGQDGNHGGGYDPHDPNRGGPMPPVRSKRPLIIGAIVGAVVLVGGAIMAVNLLGGDSGKKSVATTAPPTGANPQGTGPANGPTTAATKPTTTTGPLGAKLKNRSTDPKPLTLAEVFKHHKFGRYVMTAQHRDVNCTKVVHGAKFAAALKSGGCTQLLRATFTTTDGKLIGTIGVANLKTDTAAKKAQQAGEGKDAWLLPLPGSGTSKKIGKGSALGTSEARGHYVLLSWVQRPDGKDLTAGQRGTVSTFVTQVTLGSNLTTALQYRGISGKPYGT